MPAAKTAPAPELDEWDALFEAAEDAPQTDSKRPRVQVPQKVVDFVQSVYDSQKPKIIAVRDQAHFNELRSGFLSGADLAKDENGDSLSATCKVQYRNEADGDAVTHLRLSVGKRRGGSTGRKAKAKTEAVGDAS